MFRDAGEFVFVKFVDTNEVARRNSGQDASSTSKKKKKEKGETIKPKREEEEKPSSRHQLTPSRVSDNCFITVQTV